MASFRQISQETFDEVVQENIDEFDMTIEDAVKDAVVQFQKQAVDLSNIDTTGGIGRQEMLDAIERLSQSVSNSQQLDILKSISDIKVLCDKSHPQSARNVMLLKQKDGVNNIIKSLALFDNDQDGFVKVSKVLQELSEKNGTYPK